MAMAVKLLVDEKTFVEIVEGGDRFVAIRGGDTIALYPTGASVRELIDALIAAVIEAGWDVPDLSRHGYRMTEGDK